MEKIIGHIEKFTYQNEENGYTVLQLVYFPRKQAKLTQKELARLSGVGKTVVFDIESGKLNVRLSTLLPLLLILHVLNIKMEFTSPLMSLFKEELDEKR